MDKYYTRAPYSRELVELDPYDAGYHYASRGGKPKSFKELPGQDWLNGFAIGYHTGLREGEEE